MTNETKMSALRVLPFDTGNVYNAMIRKPREQRILDEITALLQAPVTNAPHSEQAAIRVLLAQPITPAELTLYKNADFDGLAVHSARAWLTTSSIF